MSGPLNQLGRRAHNLFAHPVNTPKGNVLQPIDALQIAASTTTLNLLPPQTVKSAMKAVDFSQAPSNVQWQCVKFFTQFQRDAGTPISVEYLPVKTSQRALLSQLSNTSIRPLLNHLKFNTRRYKPLDSTFDRIVLSTLLMVYGEIPARDRAWLLRFAAQHHRAVCDTIIANRVLHSLVGHKDLRLRQCRDVVAAIAHLSASGVALEKEVVQGCIKHASEEAKRQASFSQTLSRKSSAEEERIHMLAEFVKLIPIINTAEHAEITVDAIKATRRSCPRLPAHQLAVLIHTATRASEAIVEYPRLQKSQTDLIALVNDAIQRLNPSIPTMKKIEFFSLLKALRILGRRANVSDNIAIMIINRTKTLLEEERSWGEKTQLPPHTVAYDRSQLLKYTAFFAKSSPSLRKTMCQLIGHELDRCAAAFKDVPTNVLSSLIAASAKSHGRTGSLASGRVTGASLELGEVYERLVAAAKSAAHTLTADEVRGMLWQLAALEVPNNDLVDVLQRSLSGSFDATATGDIVLSVEALLKVLKIEDSGVTAAIKMRLPEKNREQAARRGSVQKMPSPSRFRTFS